MQTFLTTSNAPPWTFTITDKQGQPLPGFLDASFVLTFRSINTRQKTRGQGSFLVTDPSTGEVQYTLDDADLATAYATASPVSGREPFEIFMEAEIGALVYDASPATIQIQKI